MKIGKIFRGLYFTIKYQSNDVCIFYTEIRYNGNGIGYYIWNKSIELEKGFSKLNI